jgi:hypothetical protein
MRIRKKVEKFEGADSSKRARSISCSYSGRYYYNYLQFFNAAYYNNNKK